MGTKIQPIINNEINDAFPKSSNPNITTETKSGIVSKGCPMTEIKFAILCFILNINLSGL